MLIHSERHRPDDIELWRDYETSDYTYYESHNMLDKEDSALNAILEFGLKESYVGASWGKDSTVVAHLAWRVFGGRIPLIYVAEQGQENPYCRTVMERFLSNYPMHCEIVDQPVEINISDRTDKSNTFLYGIKAGQRKLGVTRPIQGVRAEESGDRTLSARVHGVSTNRVCRPILRWNASYVFAYLAYYNLPIHPNYAMLGGGRWERNRIRVGSMGGVVGDGSGRAEWEREYYPDILAYLHS